MINGISDQHVLSYNQKKKSDFEIGVLKVTLSKVWIDSGRSRFLSMTTGYSRCPRSIVLGKTGLCVQDGIYRSGGSRS